MPLHGPPLYPARSGEARWWQRGWIAPTALALLPALIFLRAALLRGVFYVQDVQYYFHPYHVLAATLLKRGELPLWNPYAFCGMPLLGDGQTALFYPPNWLFFLLPGVAALNYDILVQFSIAGVGMYLFSRSLGLWRLPAFLGAAIYMFCGCLTARIVHLSILSGAALVPLVFLCVEMAFRSWADPEPKCPAVPGPPARDAENGLLSPSPGPRTGRPIHWRWFVAAATAVGMQALAGHPQVPIYTALAVGLYALLRSVERWRRGGSGRWLYRSPMLVAGIYLLGYGFAAIQIMPWVELGAASTRAAGASFAFVFGKSMAGGDYLLQLFPYLYGALQAGPYADQPVLMPAASRFWEHSAYVGMLPLGLAAYALLGLRRPTIGGRSEPSTCYSLLFFALLAGGGLVLAMGGATPLAHVTYRMPLIGRLREVERALVLVDFAVAALAAFGMQRLIAQRSSPGGTRRWSLVIIGATTVALPGAVVLLAPQPWFQRVLDLPQQFVVNLQPQRLNAAVPLALALASAALLVWWSRRPPTRLTQALAAGLVLLDMGSYAATFTPTIDPQLHNRRPDVLAALSHEPRPFRKVTFLRRNDVVNRKAQEALAVSWGMVYGVEDVNGFNSLQPRRYTDYLFGQDAGDVSYGTLVDDGLLRPESPILSALNVKYLFLPAGERAQVGAGFREVYQNAQVRVYENTLAYPRFFFAETVRRVTDAAAVLHAVTSDGFDGRRLALVETDQLPELPTTAGQDWVKPSAWNANRISLETGTATPRFLVLSEMYFSGWQALVDGAKTPIYRTNYLFRGVVVPPGRHTITFVYRPLSVLLGAGISGLAFVVAATLLRTRRRSSTL